MYKLQTHCRACGFGRGAAPGTKSAANEKLIPVFDLGLQALANDFCGEGDERAGYAPLQVLFCPRCTLAQLSVVVKPEVLYRHYLYVTSPSETMRQHFNALTNALQAEQDFGSVLEIGSNDGEYLNYLRQNGPVVCGIDPADNLAHIARKKGIPTITGVLDNHTALEALRIAPRAFDLIVARHVFCHVDDWKAFVDVLACVSHRDTLVAIEVPYVVDLLERGEFDTIYHEHTSYLSLNAVVALLFDSAWTLCSVQRFPVHGGAIVLMLRRRDRSAILPALPSEVYSEHITAEGWKDFRQKAHANIKALENFVRQAHEDGKTVASMGASAKSTVWINACHFTRKDIAFITDNTPQKQWRFSPGSDIAIVDEGAILREFPDYLICWPWNYRAELISKNQRYLEKGGKIVFPIPQLEVVGSEKGCTLPQAVPQSA